MSHVPVFVVKITAYDVLAHATTTLWYSNHAFSTVPGVTPADTFIDARLKSVTMNRRLFSPGSTRQGSNTGAGLVVLNNEDGELDPLARYGFDGREIIIYEGDEDDEFPTDYDTLFTGTMVDGIIDGGELNIELRDAQADLDKPLQTTTFAGDNALPAGLEGVADLKDKPKPLVYGLVRNVAPPQVNTSKLIYEVSGRSVSSVDMVFDSGIALLPLDDFTVRTTTSSSGTPLWIIWVDEDSQFVAVFGTASQNFNIYTSPDGVTWTSRALPSTPGAGLNKLAHGGGLYVVVGGDVSNSIIYSSADAITWVARTSNKTTTDELNGVAYGAGKWVAVGNSGEVVTSSDGTTWAAASGTTPGASTLSSVAYAFGSFWAVGADGDIHQSTDDGDTWTEVFAGTDVLRTIQFVNGKLMVGGTGVLLTSLDGVTWESRSVPAFGSTDHWQIAYGNGYYAATSVFGFAVSSDGLTWATYGARRPICVAFGPTAGADGYGAWVIGVDAGASPANRLYSTPAQTTYTSEADLLDDSLAPSPGTFKAYPAGGQFRLGSPPFGQITADITGESTDAAMTAGQLFTDVLAGVGLDENAENIQLLNDISTWTGTSGTPVVTSSVSDPDGGTDAYTVEDDAGGVSEYKYEVVPLTGDGQKVVDFIVRENTQPATQYQSLALFDNTGGVYLVNCQITGWVGGEPTVTAALGTHVSTVAVGNGYWRIRFQSAAATAASTHWIWIRPAWVGTDTGSIDVYRVRVYNESFVGASAHTNMTNLVTNTDISTWTSVGTPVITSGVSDPIGGTDSYSVEDDDGAVLEAKWVLVSFSGDAVKVFEAVFRRNVTATAGNLLFRLYDLTGTTTRCDIAITGWTDLVPTVSVTTGTLVSVSYVGNGYWRVVALSTSVTSANTHRAYIYPATTSGTGIVDVFRVRAYDSATFTDAWDWMDVERADNANATVCGLYVGMQPKTISEALTQLVNSIGAWWGADRHGVYRLRVLGCPTDSTNALSSPRDITSGDWTNTRSTDLADQAYAPDGTLTMDELIEDGTAGNTHYISQTLPAPTVDDQSVTFEAYLMRGSGTRNARLHMVVKDGSVAYLEVDLSDGSLFSVFGLQGYSVTEVGSGLFRCRMTTTLASGATAPSVNVFLLDALGSTVYNGDSSSSIYVWGLRVVKDIAATITANDIVGRPRRLSGALPTYKHRVLARKNWTVQGSGLAGGVSDARRVVLAEPYQAIEDIDTAVQTLHLNAGEQEVETLLDTVAGATTEAARLQGIRGIRRERYEITVPMNAEYMDLDLGDYVEIDHPRFDLSGGKAFIIMRHKMNANTKRLELEVWG